jgi:hypothetical protein
MYTIFTQHYLALSIPQPLPMSSIIVIKVIVPTILNTHYVKIVKYKNT